MEIGFLIAPYAKQPLDEVLLMLKQRFPALSMIEIGVSLYGVAHCNPPACVAYPSKRGAFEETIAGRGFRLSALSAHGNPLHPNPEIAKTSRERLENAIELMALLDRSLARDAEGRPVRVVNCFSGLPAPDIAKDGAGTFVQKGMVPGWHTAPWPDEHVDSFALQIELAGAVWREIVARARDKGVELAWELHPNMLAHNPETYLQLLEAIGDDGTTLGLNFDPSHFFWRSMDPIAVVRHLGRRLRARAIKHVHGKDTYVDRYNLEIQGNQSMVPYSREKDRVWRFVSIGEGWDPFNGAHDLNWWSRFVTELQLWGYDHVVSIEHEDSRKSFEEGLGKALAILERAVNRERPGPMTWANR